MASTIKGTFTKLISFIPGLHRSTDKMSDLSKFKPTDNLDHRYGDPKVLREHLKKLGFPDEKIRIQASESNGLEVQLERQLTEKEKSDIFRSFQDAKRGSRKPSSKEIEGDD
ncbi:hypothetical protein F4825DRAFT_455272 [Nemania diffusa]|nr:hypothetical protein F4825DRAFT_455272 [Nemania diffusa]